MFLAFPNIIRYWDKTQYGCYVAPMFVCLFFFLYRISNIIYVFNISEIDDYEFNFMELKLHLCLFKWSAYINALAIRGKWLKG